MALYFASAEDQAKICCLGGPIAFCSKVVGSSKSCCVLLICCYEPNAIRFCWTMLLDLGKPDPIIFFD